MFTKNKPIITSFSYRCFFAGNTSQDQFINRELKHGAHNYKPLPVVISKAQGIFLN